MLQTACVELPANSALQQIECDVDDHVLLATDHTAFAQLDQNVYCLDAVASSCNFCMAKEARINAGVAESESLAINTYRTILEWANQIICCVHESVTDQCRGSSPACLRLQ